MGHRGNAGKKRPRNEKPGAGAKTAHGAAISRNPTENPQRVLYESFLEGFDSGVAIVQSDGTIDYANRKFAETLRGNHFGPMAGSNLRKCFDFLNWREVQNALEAASSGAIDGKLQLVEPSGPPRSMALLFYPITDGTRDKIAIVMRDVTQQKSTAEALEESEMRRRNLAAQMSQAQDRERRRLAEDLHDVIGQELAVAIMTLGAAVRELDHGGGRAREAVKQADESVRKVESDVRTMSYVLHPPLLDQIGLEAALRWFRDGFVKRTGIDVEIRVDDNVPRLQTEQETALFRVIQEALTNVYRHSRSRRAWVHLGLRDSQVEACIEDEGQGFEPGKPLNGVGIQSMRGRMESFGGGLEVERRRKRTRVLASMPATEANRQQQGFNSEKMSRSEYKATTQTGKARRILIADDHDVTREGIKALLAAEPDLEVCGEADNGLEAIEKAMELEPDLIIMDLSMPVMGGFTAANRIRRSGLNTRMLVLTTHSYSKLPQTARAAGCDGFVTKGNANADLIRAVRAVLSGEEFFPQLSSAAGGD